MYKRRTECCPFFSRRVCRHVAYGKKTRCCPFFPFNFPCAGVWIRFPEWALLDFPHLPWWLKTTVL